MSSESLRHNGQEAMESRVEFLPGASYNAPEGLPGFPEAKEFTVHHVETVAHQKILWFSGPNHSLDYAILDDPKKLPATPETGKVFEYPEKETLRQMFTQEGSFTFAIKDYGEYGPPIKKLLGALYKNKFFQGSPTLETKPHLSIGKDIVETEHHTPEAETEAANYKSTELITFGRDLLAALSEANPTKAAEFAKILRLMISAEKKFQRTTPPMPPELWQPDKIEDQSYQQEFKSWLEAYYASAYHDLPDHIETKKLVQRALAMEESSPSAIITPNHLMPHKWNGSYRPSLHKSSIRNIQKYTLPRFQSLMGNLKLQANQIKERLSFSPTFQDPSFTDALYNPARTNEGNPSAPKKNNLIARIRPHTDLLGSFVVAINGVQRPEPIEEAQPKGNSAPKTESTQRTLDQRMVLGAKKALTGTAKLFTQKQTQTIKRPHHIYRRDNTTEEFIGSGPESRVSFYFHTPVGPNGETVGQVPTGFEIFCPKTQNAELLKKLLLNHPDTKIKKFFELLDINNHLTVTGDYYLLCQVHDIKDAIYDSKEEWESAMKMYKTFLNPIKILAGIDALDPESATTPVFAKIKAQSVDRAAKQFTPQSALADIL